jgi:histone acetyltransferase (RNA polymerase elongator complex component)
MKVYVVKKRYIIPIFIPHYGCPHQCIFCDQRTITGSRRMAQAEDVVSRLREHLSMINHPRAVEIAFYGGSFTALDADKQVELLTPAKAALDAGEAQAIRLSTRPDAIDNEKVERLINYGVSTVELGVQSLDDKVLAAAGRGHIASDVLRAVEILKKHRLNCGIQLMPGLPGEDWPSLIQTANGVVGLTPDFVRIYPTIVIADTPLAALYHKGKYQPLSLNAAVSRSAYLKQLFDNNNIPVIRLGLQASEELSQPGVVVAGPYHPAFGEMVSAYLFNLMVSHCIESMYPIKPEWIEIHHHPLDHSKLRGVANKNLKNWQSNYRIGDIQLIPDWSRRGELAINSGSTCFVVNGAMMSDY